MTAVIVAAVVLVFLVLAGLALWRLSGHSGRRLQRFVEVDDLTRRYVLWLPERHAEKAPLPVVLAFHGAFGTPEQLEESSSLHLAEEAQNFIIAYPEGYDRSWNAILCCGPAMRDNIDDVKFVGAVIDDLAAAFGIDTTRVYATGFSNGAHLTYYLALKMGERIAAIAPVAGAMQDFYPGSEPTRAMPVFHWHGLDDHYAPYHGGMPLIETAPHQPPVENGIEYWRDFDEAYAATRQKLYDGSVEGLVYSGGRDGARVQLYRVPGLGHQWPGTQPRGQYAKVAAAFGPLGPAVDANNAILRFFREYALPRRIEWNSLRRTG